MHSKAFHALFKLIIDKCSLLKKVIFILIFFLLIIKLQKLNINKENFVDVLGEYIYLKTDHYEYKQILKILTYGDVVFQETIFEEIKFVPFSLVLDEEKNYKNVKYVQNALNEENKYFEEQIDGLKDILDKITDMCETKGFLQKNVLEELNKFLDEKNNDILINFPQFYFDNIDSNNSEL